ncbi:MAG: hypothetical protein JJ959_05720 [Nisaea sp.]|uniref:hypothetical protein n=1 Tax=Nisaea sp. TaxID=2024842 RepID=UPI001B1D43AC|nr:hypothetical protein [Nisaea sp.]MBO6560012.1 hypothetical protein [Nisaea sp.]
MRISDCSWLLSARAAMSSKPTEEFTIAWPFPPVATIVPEITVPPEPACATRALLAGCPTESTRTGKSAPGGRAVAGCGTDAAGAEVAVCPLTGLAEEWGAGVTCREVVGEAAAADSVTAEPLCTAVDEAATGVPEADAGDATWVDGPATEVWIGAG